MDPPSSFESFVAQLYDAEWDQSGGRHERVVAHVSRCQAMKFDADSNQWLPLQRVAGRVLALIQCPRNKNAPSICRIIAGTFSKKTGKGEVYIDAAIEPDLLYQRPSQSFVQWKQGDDIFGLNFTTVDDCDDFDHQTTKIIDALKANPHLGHSAAFKLAAASSTPAKDFNKSSGSSAARKSKGSTVATTAAAFEDLAGSRGSSKSHSRRSLTGTLTDSGDVVPPPPADDRPPPPPRTNSSVGPTGGGGGGHVGGTGGLDDNDPKSKRRSRLLNQAVMGALSESQGGVPPPPSDPSPRGRTRSIDSAALKATAASPSNTLTPTNSGGPGDSKRHSFSSPRSVASPRGTRTSRGSISPRSTSASSGPRPNAPAPRPHAGTPANATKLAPPNPPNRVRNRSNSIAPPTAVSFATQNAARRTSGLSPMPERAAASGTGTAAATAATAATTAGAAEERFDVANADRSTRNLTDLKVACTSQRDKIVREIYTSESKYLEGLLMLEHEFLASHPFKEEEAKTIFGNVSAIKDFSKTVLKNVRDRLREWSDVACIGDAFVSLMPYFKLYETYCNNHESAIERLLECKKRKDVHKYLLEHETSCNYTLPALLITPVQRIPRYVLLLKDLARNTLEGHPDYESLYEAVDSMEAVADKVNRGMRGFQAQQKYVEVQQSGRFAELPSLVAPQREFIDCSGQASKNKPELLVQLGMERYTALLLFNDLLVIAGDTGELRWRLPLDHTWVEDLDKEKFLIMTPDTSMRFIVEASSAHLKTKWLDMIQRTIEDWLNKKQVQIDSVSGARYCRYVAESGDEFEGYMLSGKMVGRGKMVTGAGDRYKGHWVDGRKNGEFEVVYANGDIYRGQMSGDAPHGYGRLSSATGHMVYEGEYESGCRHGRGRMEWSRDCYYDGEWAFNHMSGHGLLVTPDGDRYEGAFEKGRRHGRGKLTRANGAEYEGEFSHDLRTGDGTMRYASGARYAGAWKNDKRQGKGTYVVKSRDGRRVVLRYEGTWLHDRYEGHGTLARFGGAETYEGQFHDGREHGTGVWRSAATGESYDGQWEGGDMHGTGVFMYADGSKYEGTLQRGRRTGQGVFVEANGAVYRGEWRNNARSGTGKYSSADGKYTYDGEWFNDRRHGRGEERDHYARFVGAWRDGARHGVGTLELGDGTVLEGEWQDDVPVGSLNVRHADGSTSLQGWDARGAQTGDARRWLPFARPCTTT